MTRYLAVAGATVAAASLSLPASAQQVPLRQLLASAYEIRTVTHLGAAEAAEVTPSNTFPIALVTLQKGGSTAVCWFSFSGFISLSDVVLDSQKACDVRGSETAAYAFEGPSHAGFVGTWRLDTRNGQLAWCTFEKPANSDGITACAAATAAVPGDAGPFRLVAHRRADDNSIQRVSLSTGSVWICFPRAEAGTTKVMCTAPAR
jgi:hypothetical protein